MTDLNDTHGTETLIKDKVDVKEPVSYQVVMLNDHYTTTEFVTMILQSIFHKNPIEAERIMLAIHNKGSEVVEVYVKEIAEAKIAKVHQVAKDNEYPLKCIMEPI